MTGLEETCAVAGHPPAILVRDDAGDAIAALCECGSVTWRPEPR